MKTLASQSKLFQSCSKAEIPSQARQEEHLSHHKLKQTFLIVNSDAELFVYFIKVLGLAPEKFSALLQNQILSHLWDILQNHLQDAQSINLLHPTGGALIILIIIIIKIALFPDVIKSTLQKFHLKLNTILSGEKSKK